MRGYSPNINGEEIMKSAELRLHATGMFQTTAIRRATRWSPATSHTPAMQEDAALRVLDHGSNAWPYGQSGFLRHWALEEMWFLLPAYRLVPARAEAAVDEALVDRAGLAGLEETAEESRGCSGCRPACAVGRGGVIPFILCPGNRERCTT